MFRRFDEAPMTFIKILELILLDSKAGEINVLTFKNDSPFPI